MHCENFGILTHDENNSSNLKITTFFRVFLIRKPKFLEETPFFEDDYHIRRLLCQIWNNFVIKKRRVQFCLFCNWQISRKKPDKIFSSMYETSYVKIPNSIFRKSATVVFVSQKPPTRFVKNQLDKRLGRLLIPVKFLPSVCSNKKLRIFSNSCINFEKVFLHHWFNRTDVEIWRLNRLFDPLMLKSHLVR